MAQHVVHTQLPGQLVMLGCGSIGQAVLPLILRHLGVTPDRITDRDRRCARPRRGCTLRDRFPRDGADAGQLPPRARAAGRRRRLPAQPVGRRQQHRHRRVLPRAWCSLPRHRRRAVGRHVFRPQPDPGAIAPTMRCARACCGCGASWAAGRPRSARKGPTPAWSRSWPRRRRCRWRTTRACRIASRPTGRAGRSCSATWVSRRSTSPSVTRRSRVTPSGRASSSTPGRSTASSRRAASRPSWAGARTSGISRSRAAAMPPAAGPRST